jgi:hypothetical protein
VNWPTTASDNKIVEQCFTEPNEASGRYQQSSISNADAINADAINADAINITNLTT